MKDDFLDRPFKPMDEIDVDAAYAGISATIHSLSPSLPTEFYDRFRAVTAPVLFCAGQVIIDYGEICRNCYFMLSGLVRSTKILNERGETPVWFHRDGDVVIAVDSYYTQSPSDEKLTAITGCFCIALPWAQLQELYNEFVQFNAVGRMLTEKYLRQVLERTTWFYESPEARYKHVVRDYPSVAEHVSVKELASYLGMARETLSRLRRRYARRG